MICTYCGLSVDTSNVEFLLFIPNHKPNGGVWLTLCHNCFRIKEYREDRINFPMKDKKRILLIPESI